MSKLLQQIAQGEINKESIADKIITKSELLPEALEGLSSNKPNIKYGCAKVLNIISEKAPKILYPKIDFFIELLDNDNKILQWNAILIIANLAVVDSKNRFEKIFDKYFSPIRGPIMVTAANVIKGAAKIALAKPRLTEKITKELLKVERAKYQTSECRNVALGHTIKSFDQFFNQIKDKKPVVRLIRKQLKNTRNATRKKAEKFVKKYKL
jgi:hypothetical protein